jgi:DNA-binding winged helix-turn-helix (wHTH) protein
MTFPRSAPVRFGIFEFDPSSGDLRKHGLTVRLTPQAKALLSMLVEPPIRTHTREEIQRRLWPANIYVDFEHGVNKVVHSLREALGETAGNPRFIETVADQGYRFLLLPQDQRPANDHLRTAGAVERIAVLPIATDPEEELICMGKLIASLLIERLALAPGIRVMAASTVKSYKLESSDPRQTAECLGVDAVLAGDLTRQNGHLLLQVELIDAVDGALRGGAHVQRFAQPEVSCVEELALEACQRILPFLRPSADTRKPPQPVSVMERRTKAS